MNLHSPTQRQHNSKHAHHPWQPKTEHAALTLFAFNRNGAAAKYPTYLFILVDDALTVEQPETMRRLNVGRRRVYHLAFEQVRPFLFGHSHASIGNHDVYITLLLGNTCAKRNLAVSFCKLACIVYQRVNHKECERAVGLHHLGCRLHHQLNPLVFKSHSAFTYDVEERLQRHTFHVQAQFSLPHLYPLGQNGVVFFYLIGKLLHIVQPFLPNVFGFLHGVQPMNFVPHPVDKGHNRVYQRHLGTLFDVLLLVLHHMPFANLLLFVQFFVAVVLLFNVLCVHLFPLPQGFEHLLWRIFCGLPGTQGVEEIEQKHHQHDGHTHIHKHHVKLFRRIFKLFGSRLLLLVLSGLSLYVEINVAVHVALAFHVHGRIHQAELFADRRHQVGGFSYGRVSVQGVLQTEKGRLVIFQCPVARGQCTVCTSRLINVAIARKHHQRPLCQVACQQTVGHVVGVKYGDGRCIISQQLAPLLLVY